MNIPNKYFYPFTIILSLFTIQILFLFIADIRLILDLIPDDAAYYFKIAENFNKGYGFSFDQIHQTNGFQPLWQYSLAALYYFIPLEPESFYRAALILQTIIISFSALLFYRIVFKSKGEVNALLSLGIMISLLFKQSINGMESAVVIIMLVVLYFFFSKDSFSKKDYIISGALTGMLLLGRLDFIFLPGIIFSLIFFKNGLKPSLLFAAGCLIIFLPYALTNYFMTGHIQPISGVLKSSFPHIILNPDIQYTATGIITVVSALAAVILYIILHLKKIFNKTEYISNHQLLLYSLSLFILFHYSFYLFFTKWPVVNYYFIFYGIVLSFITAALWKYKLNYKYIYLFISLAVISVVLKTGFHLNKDLSNSWHVKSYDAAVWARTNTPSNAVFAMKDAGNFGFISKRRVINLDGLVNDYYFQKVLKDKTLNKYLKINNVSYYVLYESSAGQDLFEGSYDYYREAFMSYQYMEMSDRINMESRNEVYRKSFNNSVFIIWKIY
jgi:hypothetical protein